MWSFIYTSLSLLSRLFIYFLDCLHFRESSSCMISTSAVFLLQTMASSLVMNSQEIKGECVTAHALSLFNWLTSIMDTVKKKILDYNNLSRLELNWGFWILSRIISQYLNSICSVGKIAEESCKYFLNSWTLTWNHKLGWKGHLNK